MGLGSEKDIRLQQMNRASSVLQGDWWEHWEQLCSSTGAIGRKNKFKWQSCSCCGKAHLQRAGLVYVGSKVACGKGQTGCTALIWPCWAAGLSGGSPPQPVRYCFPTPHWETEDKAVIHTPSVDLFSCRQNVMKVPDAFTEQALSRLMGKQRSKLTLIMEAVQTYRL